MCTSACLVYKLDMFPAKTGWKSVKLEGIWKLIAWAHQKSGSCSGMLSTNLTGRNAHPELNWLIGSIPVDSEIFCTSGVEAWLMYSTTALFTIANNCGNVTLLARKSVPVRTSLHEIVSTFGCATIQKPVWSTNPFQRLTSRTQCS